MNTCWLGQTYPEDKARFCSSVSQFTENILGVFNGKLSLRKQNELVNGMQLIIANNQLLVNELFINLLLNELLGNKLYWLLVNERILKWLVNKHLANQMSIFDGNELVNELFIKFLEVNKRKRPQIWFVCLPVSKPGLVNAQRWYLLLIPRH